MNFWPFRRRPRLPEGIPGPPRDLNEDQRIIRAQHAAALLADPLIDEAFKTVRWAICDGWANSGDNQDRERERLYMRLRLLGEVRKFFEAAVEDGRKITHDRNMAAKERSFLHPIR